jgi:hypothetical protein
MNFRKKNKTEIDRYWQKDKLLLDAKKCFKNLGFLAYAFKLEKMLI